MTVPRRLPPSQSERLNTMLTRMLPGQFGGQTRHIGPVGRRRDTTTQYRPVSAGPGNRVAVSDSVNIDDGDGWTQLTWSGYDFGPDSAFEIAADPRFLVWLLPGVYALSGVMTSTPATTGEIVGNIRFTSPSGTLFPSQSEGITVGPVHGSDTFSVATYERVYYAPEGGVNAYAEVRVYSPAATSYDVGLSMSVLKIV